MVQRYVYIALRTFFGMNIIIFYNYHKKIYNVWRLEMPNNITNKAPY